MAENQFRFGTGEQLFIIQAELSSALRVKSRTVRNWIQKKWLTPHYRLLGGRLQTVFLTQQVEAFVSWYLPSLADLDAPCERGSRHDRINSLRAKSRRCANKASQASMNKRLGTEQDEDDTPAHHEEPATLDRGSARQWNMQPERPTDVDRGLTEEDLDWDEDVEGRG